MTVRTSTSWVGRLAVVSAASVALIAGFAGQAPASPDSTDPEVAQQLADVRRATVQFRSIDAAFDAGYIDPGAPCAELPGVGGMGIHLIQPSLISDSILDITQPEVLVYKPTSSGYRLVAVEYFIADADQDLATSGDRPFLFGTGFEGPMPGHAPGMPVHYDLHAWVWQSNPDGVFTSWNPSISCS